MKSNRPHLDQKLSRFLVKTLKKGVPADAEFRHNSNFLFSSLIFCTKLSILVLRLYNVLGFLQGVRFFFPYEDQPEKILLSVDFRGFKPITLGRCRQFAQTDLKPRSNESPDRTNNPTYSIFLLTPSDG